MNYVVGVVELVRVSLHVVDDLLKKRGKAHIDIRIYIKMWLLYILT
jgi:hypothetical protein